MASAAETELDRLDADARRAFRNRVASLYNIDKFVIDNALVARDGAPLSANDWADFRVDPPRFFINTDLPTAQAIWACVEARQPEDGTYV